MTGDSSRRGRIPRAEDIFQTWSTREISVYPFGAGWWPFNPSVHRDPDGIWRCIIRCANYTIPHGKVTTAPSAFGRTRTRNVLVELDPVSLGPVRASEIQEEQSLSRATSCDSMGLHDMRLFWTKSDGLMAVGCAFQYNVEHPERPEIVVCRVDQARDTPAFVDAWTIRGDWGFRAQKNWVPFDGDPDARLLYSIERGVVMTRRGPAAGFPRPVPDQGASSPDPPSRRGRIGSRDAARDRISPDELRGGSQLVQIGPHWVGVGHGMTFGEAGAAKFYWHELYALDADAKLIARSGPIKLSGGHDIEFAAGMAVDDEGRVAISYGTDDHQAWISTTTTREILGILGLPRG